MNLYRCARVNNFYSYMHADASRAIESMFFCIKQGEQIKSSVFDKFPNQQYYVHTTAPAAI